MFADASQALPHSAPAEHGLSSYPPATNMQPASRPAADTHLLSAVQHPSPPYYYYFFKCFINLSCKIPQVVCHWASIAHRYSPWAKISPSRHGEVYFLLMECTLFYHIISDQTHMLKYTESNLFHIRDNQSVCQTPTM